jgi:hypothetical protein
MPFNTVYRSNYDFNFREYLTPEWDKHWSKLHSLRGGARAKTMTKSRQGKSLPYNMSKNYLKYLYLKQEGRCAVSGTPLRLEYLFEPYHPLAPSKDRLDNDPEIGYVAGNIQLVVRLINLAKVQTSNEEFNACFYEVVKNAHEYRTSKPY